MPKNHCLILSNGSTHEYHIKLSKRAKNIRINLSSTGSLSVTVPHRMTSLKAHQFIKSKTSWVEKHLAKLPHKIVKEIPAKLELFLLNETWLIKTIPNESNQFSLTEEDAFTLTIKGNVEEVDLVKKVLNQWCRNKAKQVFASMMQSIAEEYGFHYQRLGIRTQKTRWGSCSANKNISLNSKLLFMPEPVVKYVMIHELCHTLEMNHSSRFWDLVEECDPDFKLHKKQLKEYGRLVVI